MNSKYKKIRKRVIVIKPKPRLFVWGGVIVFYGDYRVLHLL